MPQADDHLTPTPSIDPYEGWPLGALEPVILDLQTTVAVFGHLINSPDEIGKNTWAKVETDLIVAAGQIRDLWKAAWEQRIREDRAHREALDAVRAEKAAPGSAEEREQVEALWVLLRSAVTVAAGQCHEAGFPLPGWRWEAGGTVMTRTTTAGTGPADEPIWALLRKRADDFKAGGRRTPNEAASDLIVLGEILQMFDQCDDISGAVVAWLGDQVAKAADEVFSALMIAPAPKLPEGDA
jgi:hypothetical protein